MNQHIKVTNSDPNSHNIHPMPKPGTANHEWNKSQPAGAAPFDVSWPAQEVAIHVKCNIHPWMSGYMAVVKGPTATSDNNGLYTRSNMPPGNYTLTAWQETYGTQTQKVTVSAGAPAKADFTFKAKRQESRPRSLSTDMAAMNSVETFRWQRGYSIDKASGGGESFGQKADHRRGRPV